MKPKRNHHIQPNFYLKGFCSTPIEGNPKVWVYEKGKEFDESKNEKLQNPRHLTTEKTAREKDFYAFVENNGEINYQKYEDILEQEFEKPSDSILLKIRQFQEINNNEKEIFSKYVSSMHIRSKEGKRITDLSLDLAVKYQLSRNLNLTESVIKNYEKFVRNVEDRNELHKESILKKSPLLATSLTEMQWVFYTSKSLKFITCDNPVAVYKLQDRDKTGYLIFPISSNVVLYASWRKGRDMTYQTANEKVVQDFRDIFAKIALKEVYFSKKAEWLVRYINNRTVNL